jgi:hypothetical protein
MIGDEVLCPQPVYVTQKVSSPHSPPSQPSTCVIVSVTPLPTTISCLRPDFPWRLLPCALAMGSTASKIKLSGLDDRGSRARFPAGTGYFSLHHRVQNGSGAHPASYPMGTRGSFPGGTAAEAWSWPLTSISCRGQRMSWAIPPLPNTPSWRGGQLKVKKVVPVL